MKRREIMGLLGGTGMWPLAARAFQPVAWHGERKLALPELGGELRFRRARGAGIDPKWVESGALQVKLRSGGDEASSAAERVVS